MRSRAVLDGIDPGLTVSETIDVWQAVMALDAVIDDEATLTGGDADLYQVDRLHARDQPETGAGQRRGRHPGRRPTAATSSG